MALQVNHLFYLGNARVFYCRVIIKKASAIHTLDFRDVVDRMMASFRAGIPGKTSCLEWFCFSWFVWSFTGFIDFVVIHWFRFARTGSPWMKLPPLFLRKGDCRDSVNMAWGLSLFSWYSILLFFSFLDGWWATDVLLRSVDDVRPYYIFVGKCYKNKY